mmetsp:Transcript_32/g.55  ORF Transcript_32/g.55 Transcript_32/m.55 type:complete len:298 (-) Transcript_32:615-1508(-)
MTEDHDELRLRHLVGLRGATDDVGRRFLSFHVGPPPSPLQSCSFWKTAVDFARFAPLVPAVFFAVVPDLAQDLKEEISKSFLADHTLLFSLVPRLLHFEDANLADCRAHLAGRGHVISFYHDCIPAIYSCSDPVFPGDPWGRKNRRPNNRHDDYDGDGDDGDRLDPRAVRNTHLFRDCGCGDDDGGCDPRAIPGFWNVYGALCGDVYGPLDSTNRLHHSNSSDACGVSFSSCVSFPSCDFCGPFRPHYRRHRPERQQPVRTILSSFCIHPVCVLLPWLLETWDPHASYEMPRYDLPQ